MMKGKLKHMISILLISVLVLSMAAPGFAAGSSGTNTHKLTINSQTAGHTFEIYQIFSGDVDISDEGMVLTDIDWGSGVNAGKLITALADALEDPDSALQDAFGNIDLSGDADDLAVVVAKALSDVATRSNAAYAFADVVGAGLETVYASTTEDDEYAYEKDTDGYFYYYEIDGLEDGYYFLKDQDDSLDLDDDDLDTGSYTRYILGIIGADQEINAKADKPNIDKHIGATEKTEEYDIGENIPYQLTSKVPDMEGYTTYWYMAHDTLSKGIDFIQVDSITVGTQELEKARQVDIVYNSDGSEKSSVETGSVNNELKKNTYTVYNYEYNDADGVKEKTELYIVLNKFCESYKGDSWVGKSIVIDYTVRFNKNAVIGIEGNDNVVDLIYSNDPNYAYSGEPTTTTDEHVGKTTKKTTITFTSGIRIIKYDGETDTNLAGASFKLTGYGETEVPYYTWEQTAEYSYYTDSAGLYVNKNENVTGADAEFVAYDSAAYSGYTRYSRTTTSENSTYTATTRSQDGAEELIGTTGSDGYVTFNGIGAGIYKLEEVSAPSGYNKLTSPIYVRIVYEDPDGYEDATLLTLSDQPEVETDTATWTFYSSYDPDLEDSEWEEWPSEGGIAIISIANSAGSLMPATGGVGTVVFTIVGICAMAGAVIFLYVKKRREDL